MKFSLIVSDIENSEYFHEVQYLNLLNFTNQCDNLIPDFKNVSWTSFKNELFHDLVTIGVISGLDSRSRQQPRLYCGQ